MNKEPILQAGVQRGFSVRELVITLAGDLSPHAAPNTIDQRMENNDK